MSSPDLAAAELLQWNDLTASAWRKLTTAQPAVLQLPCDIHKSTTVGQLLQHIVAAELRYAERLAELPVSDYSSIPYSTAEEIFSTHDRALTILRSLLADSSFDWSCELEFSTLTAGRLRARRNAIFLHALLHGIRHYAQLSTLVRQHGFRSSPADYLLTAAVPVET